MLWGIESRASGARKAPTASMYLEYCYIYIYIYIFGYINKYGNKVISEIFIMWRKGKCRPEPFLCFLGKESDVGEEVLDWPVWIIPGTTGVWEVPQDAP